jgi:putative membrane protein
MTEAPPRPFLILEETEAPRLESPLVPRPEAPLALAPLSGRLPLSVIGAGILVLGLPALWTAGFVADQFTRSAALGWGTLAVGVAGFALILAAIARELRGLFALDRVDRLRLDLASGDPARVQAAARAWLAMLPDGAALRPAIDAVDTPEAMLALLRAGPAATLRGRVDALGRNAAFQAGALIAATPSPALEGLAVGWRGVRLIRQVAAAHGLRPGLLGTLSLLRRTALSAATVAATELAVNAAAHALLSNKLLSQVLGDVAGASVAARRMIVLARAASAACTPLNE